MSFMMCVFFFKQKTAYEMRISDWSSDVCSSDLAPNRNSGDVHQYVETPVRLMDVACKCLYRRKVGNVERALQMDLRTEFTRLSCDSFKRRSIDIGEK